METIISDKDKEDTYVIIPAYNEETRVQPVVEGIAEKEHDHHRHQLRGYAGIGICAGGAAVEVVCGR